MPKVRIVVLRIVGLVFMGLGVVFWLYGSGSHRALDAIMEGLAGACFFALSFYAAKKTLDKTE